VARLALSAAVHVTGWAVTVDTGATPPDNAPPFACGRHRAAECVSAERL